MAAQVTPVSQPLVQIEWLPWHHTWMGCNAAHRMGFSRTAALFISTMADRRPKRFMEQSPICTTSLRCPHSMSQPVTRCYAPRSASRSRPEAEVLPSHRQNDFSGGAATPAAVMATLQESAIEVAGERSSDFGRIRRHGSRADPPRVIDRAKRRERSACWHPASNSSWFRRWTVTRRGSVARTSCPVISDYPGCLRRHSTKRASIG